MTLQTVTVTWDEEDTGAAPLGGYVSFQLTADLQDTAGGTDVRRSPAKTFFFLGPSGSSDPLVANDSAGITPAGTAYVITVAIRGQQPVTFTSQLNVANGATQTLAFLQANAAVPVTQFSQYLPLPSGTPSAGQVPAAAGAGEASAWTTLTAADVGAASTAALAAEVARAEAAEALKLAKAADLSDVADAATALANLGGLRLAASTGLSGFALQNATPEIIHWDVPGDGQLHRCFLVPTMDVTSAGITGGDVSVSFTLPGGSGVTLKIITGGQGFSGFGFSLFNPPFVVAPGTTVTVSQSSALTAGTATVWAEIWAL